MSLGPVADLRQARPERLGDDVVGVADVERAVAKAREAGDVLDHLRVVVRGQECLVLGSVLHRQPADEVRQPDVRGLLLLRVLVQVVVELPRLVSDPEVVRLLPDEVVEDHEVREEDLVHPPDRLEAVQVVLGGLALDVAGLVREVGARRMDSFAPLLQHRRDGALGEPVDLQIGVELAQLVGDGRVSLRVAEADRRRDVERALAPRLAAHPARAAAGGGCTKSRSRRLALHRVTRMDEVPAALDRHELAGRDPGELDAAGMRGDRILVAVDHEHRAASPSRRARGSQPRRETVRRRG